jgi:hypothetical protein
MYYKIRDKNTGLYSNGGIYSSWGKHGKLWTSLGTLRSHLTTRLNGRIIHEAVENWEVIEYEVKECNIQNINDVMNPQKLIEILKK